MSLTKIDRDQLYELHECLVMACAMAEGAKGGPPLGVRLSNAIGLLDKILERNPTERPMRDYGSAYGDRREIPK